MLAFCAVIIDSQSKDEVYRLKSASHLNVSDDIPKSFASLKQIGNRCEIY
jgi:hypothetical protein